MTVDLLLRQEPLSTAFYLWNVPEMDIQPDQYAGSVSAWEELGKNVTGLSR
jgi:hypothetical protein